MEKKVAYSDISLKCTNEDGQWRSLSVLWWFDYKTENGQTEKVLLREMQKGMVERTPGADE